MKHLLILGQPSGENFNEVIQNQVKLLLDNLDRKVIIRDLDKIGFDPVLKKATFLLYNLEKS
ncbi:hypothetical protein AwDysgo_06680 [Bacteroidales bacterium]|nr:hypothetical protein AwDysgo_06680 [Bacteroidales bacterium]